MFKRISENNIFKTLTMCKKCYTFYYKRSWHFERPEIGGDRENEKVLVHFTECAACLEQERAAYDNELELA